MPEMDGFEASATIRRAEAPGERLPIVAMTANALVGDRERCLAAGMDDHLAKPVRFDDLVRAIERHARRPSLTLTRPDRGADRALLPVLDRSALAAITALDPSGAMLSELAGLFSAETDDTIGRLRRAAAGHDLGLLGRIGHSLAGTAGAIGARRVEAAGRALDHAAAANDVGAAARLVAVIEAALPEARVALETTASQAGAA